MDEYDEGLSLTFLDHSYKYTDNGEASHYIMLNHHAKTSTQ